MTRATRPFDPAEYLDDAESIAAYIDEAMAIGDPAFIAKALGDVARSRGMTEIAKETGLSRESLYKSLREDGNPELSTLFRVLGALGLRLSVRPQDAAE